MNKVSPKTDHPPMQHSGWPNRFDHYHRSNVSNERPNSKAPLGQGGRFAALKNKLARGGAKDPAALAASIGRKKYGAKKFNDLARKGK